MRFPLLLIAVGAPLLVGSGAHALPSASTRSPQCGRDHVASCASAGALAADPAFQSEATRFFGTARGSYVIPDARISVQVLGAMRGPSEPPERLAGGEWFLSGCRAHECQSKGALILDVHGRILAAALLSRHCHKSPPGQASCERSPTLDIFVTHRSGAEGAPAVARLQAWGEAQAAAVISADVTGATGPYQGYSIRGLADPPGSGGRRPGSPAPRAGLRNNVGG
jgi:hypothetical protein